MRRGGKCFVVTPRRDELHRRYQDAKARHNKAKKDAAKGKGRGEVASAAAAMRALAVGLQMDGMDYLFSMAAMVALDCALKRDGPERIPDWWSQDSCVVCSDPCASTCHALSGIAIC